MAAQTTVTVNHQIVELLQTAYRMEIETVANYLANSVHLDGVRAAELKRSLSEDVTEELGHARRLAQRIKELGGRVPGSLELRFDQESLLPPAETTNVKAVVQGVIEAEREAIAHYRGIIDHSEANRDPVTANLATELLADEETHCSLFEGFLAGIDAN